MRSSTRRRPAPATLSRIVPAPGDAVEKGEIVAEVTNREVVERHRGALALVDEREQALRDFKASAAAEDALVEQNVDRQRARLERIERGNRQQVETARERLDNHRQLYAGAHRHPGDGGAQPAGVQPGPAGAVQHAGRTRQPGIPRTAAPERAPGPASPKSNRAFRRRSAGRGNSRPSSTRSG